MATIFSFPAFTPGGNYTTTGYNLQKSAAVNGAPSWFGPWVDLTGYQNVASNLDVFDPVGTFNDLYRVQPIVTIGTNTNVTLDWSRPFFASQPVYDIQVSALIDHFRRNYIDDIGVPMTDSTIPTESTGSGTLPFITDAQTTRFYLSYLPNTDPVKFIPENCLVYMGTSKANAAPLIPYSDFYPAGEKGYVDFKTSPPASNYLRIEYTNVRYTNDEIRNAILNSVSQLSLYGINGYQVMSSNNLLYLASPLASRDLAEVCLDIAKLNILSARVMSSIESSEAWKNGTTEYTADPSRTIQAASLAIPAQKEIIRNKANNYILNTRQYRNRGEYESFFDTTGVLPVYTLFISQFNMFGYWI